MNNNINPLTNDGYRLLRRCLNETIQALDGLDNDDQRDQAPVMERCERILPLDLFNELRAYLGSIREAHGIASELLYGDNQDLIADGFVIDESTSPEAGA